MLLGDVDLTVGPTLAQPVKNRQDHVPKGLPEPEGDEQTIEHGLRRRFVKGIKTALECRVEAFERHRSRVSQRSVGQLCHPRRLRRRQSGVDVMAHDPYASFVLLRVKAKATRRALRGDQPVARFPGTQ